MLKSSLLLDVLTVRVATCTVACWPHIAFCRTMPTRSSGLGANLNDPATFTRPWTHFLKLLLVFICGTGISCMDLWIVSDMDSPNQNPDKTAVPQADSLTAPR